MQRIILYRNMPKGHISYCDSNISYFCKKYIILPSGNISLGVVIIPYRNSLCVGSFHIFIVRDILPFFLSTASTLTCTLSPTDRT